MAAKTQPLSLPVDPPKGSELLGNLFGWFGDLAIFTWRLGNAAIRPPFEFRELLRQMDTIGAKSFPVVAMAGAALGVVMSLQIRDSLVRFGGKSLIPAVIIFALVRESGPIITALVASGRVGAGIGAELGSMKVTEQIDAIEASAVNPYRFLAATRVLACVVMLPLLTMVADFCGVFTGWVTLFMMDSTSLQLFLNRGLKNVTFSDFLPAVFKTAVFGLIIGVVSSFQGMRAKGGTEGVGRAATSSVVLSSLFVILSDVVLVRLIQILFG